MKKLPDKKAKSGKIIVIGTSHISGESVRMTREVIEKERPDCVAVELDFKRLQGMRAGKGSNRDAFAVLGPINFVFFIMMKWVQGMLSKKTGVFPGEEMLKAVDVAEENKIQVALVDRDIAITFERLKGVGFFEKFNLILFMFSGIILGPIIGLFSKDNKIDLNKVPDKELINDATEEIRKRFPGIYRVLIGERDRYIASRLIVISKSYKKIVAFIGAGHKESVQKIIDRESQKPS
ncbi:MAG: TraB/GumN family protein [Deltaproteobacteria bacterium]|nr:TraB/GumN family protein [Deltaproteobacteria bacterium]